MRQLREQGLLGGQLIGQRAIGSAAHSHKIVLADPPAVETLGEYRTEKQGGITQLAQPRYPRTRCLGGNGFTIHLGEHRRSALLGRIKETVGFKKLHQHPASVPERFLR